MLGGVVCNCQVVGLLCVAGSWSQVMLTVHWVALGGVWALAFLVHITLCTSSSCSPVVCGHHSTVLLLTAAVFATVCCASVPVIVGLITVVSRHNLVFSAWTSRVGYILK